MTEQQEQLRMWSVRCEVPIEGVFIAVFTSVCRLDTPSLKGAA